MLELLSVSKSFKDPSGSSTAVLDDLTLKVSPGEIYGLIGPSGTGKSTALRTINLLERPEQGQVIFNQQDLMKFDANELRHARHKIGMIFQHFNLISNYTVAQNIALPLQIAGMEKEQRDERVIECLKIVGLSHKASNYPNQLSGGQKQRVAIARGIANSPSLILADEPTSALDPVTKKEVITYLKKINQELGITIIIATHDIDVVRALCQKAALLKDGSVHELISVQNGIINTTTEFGKNFLGVL